MCGDIAVAKNIDKILLKLADEIQIPIYFVLGNHDYYHGSIAKVREEVRHLSIDSNQLFWLPESGPVQLSDEVALIGHGGWGDARFGDFDESTVYLSDYVAIQELAGISNSERKAQIESIG